MLKLLNKKLQILKNFLERLRLKPIETIKFTFYALLIKQFYKTFTWIVTFMIFGPSFFEENPMESIKVILNWMWTNLTFTSSFILVKAQNIINDLIRYFTNWDIPNVENPKMNKNTLPTDTDKDTSVGAGPVHKPLRREDPETFSKYRKSWDHQSIPPQSSNIDDSWWKNTNWTYIIIGTIVVGVLVGGTYYSWDSISTFVPNVRIFKNFIWRSKDSSEGDGAGEQNNSTMIFKPEEQAFNEDITLSDVRNNDKGKEVDRTVLSRTMSQEELSEVNPVHKFQNNESSTSGISNTETSSESSTDSSSSSGGGITISNWRSRAKRYFSFSDEPWSKGTSSEQQISEDEINSAILPLSDVDFDDDIIDPSKIADKIEAKNPDIDTILPDPQDFREVPSNEVLPKEILGGTYEPISEKGTPLRRYIAHGKVIFRDDNNVVYDYNPYDNKLLPLNPNDIPYSIARLIRASIAEELSKDGPSIAEELSKDEPSNTEVPLVEGGTDWSGIPKIIVSDDDDSKTVTSDDINQTPQKIRRAGPGPTVVNDTSHLSPFANLPKITSARIVPLDEELPGSVKYGGVIPVPNDKGVILERMLVTDDKGRQEVIFKTPNKHLFYSWNRQTGKYSRITEGKTYLNQVYNLITNNTE